MGAIKEKLFSAITVLIAALLVVFIVLRTGSPANIVTTDGTIHFKQVADYLDKGKFSLQYESIGLDPAKTFLPYKWPHLLQLEGRDYLVYPELFTLYGAMLYRGLGDAGLLAAPLLPLLMALLFANLFWRELGFRGGRLVKLGLLYLFGSSILMQTLNYVEITLGLMFATIGLYLYIRLVKREHVLTAALAGMAFGLALYIRQEAALAFAVLGLLYFLLVQRRRIRPAVPVLAGGFILLLAIFFLYNHQLYGHPLGLRYASISREQVDLARRFEIMFGLLFTSLFHSDKGGIGFFGQFPFLLWLLWRPLARYRRLDLSFRVLFIYGLTLCVLVPLLAPNDGWFNWGSRYLMLAEISLLAVFMHDFYREQRPLLMRIAFGILMAWCVLFGTLGMVNGGVILEGGARLKRLIASVPGKVILSPTGAHYGAGTLITDRNILELHEAEDAPEFLNLLKKAGLREYCWIAHKHYTPDYRRAEVDFAWEYLRERPGWRITRKEDDGLIFMACLRQDSP